MATLAEWQAQQNQNVSTSSQRKKDFNFGSEDSGWAVSMAAAIPSGIFKIFEGVATLGATLMDLGVDKNRAESVEAFFDKINPFDEAASATALGKITELIVNLGVPGAPAFRIASGLTNATKAAKAAGKYIKTPEKLRRYAQGAAATGLTDLAFVGDVEEAGAFGDWMGGPTKIDRDTGTPGAELLNRLKFGIEGAAFAGAIGGVGAGIGKLRHQTGTGKAVEGKLNKFFEKVSESLRSRGKMDPHQKRIKDIEKGAVDADTALANEWRDQMEDLSLEIGRKYSKVAGNKISSFDAQQKVLKEMNDVLMSGKDNGQLLNERSFSLVDEIAVDPTTGFTFKNGRGVLKDVSPLDPLPREVMIPDPKTGKEIMENVKVIDPATGKPKQLYNVTLNDMDPQKVEAFGKKLIDEYKATPEQATNLFDTFTKGRDLFGEMFTSIGRRLRPKTIEDFETALRENINDVVDRGYSVFQKNRGQKTVAGNYPPTQAILKDTFDFYKKTAELKGYKLSDEILERLVKDTWENATLGQGFVLGSKIPQGAIKLKHFPNFLTNSVKYDLTDPTFAARTNTNLSEVTGVAIPIIKKLLGKTESPINTLVEGVTNLSAHARSGEAFDQMMRKSNELKVDYDNWLKKVKLEGREAAGKEPPLPFLFDDTGEAYKYVGGGGGDISQVGGGAYEAAKIDRFAGSKLKGVDAIEQAKIDELTEAAKDLILNPVAGKWALNPVAESFEKTKNWLDGMPAQIYNNLILYPKGTSQMAKTILAPFTHVRNFISATAFAGANGILPFGNTADVKAAWRALQAPGPFGFKKSNEFYQELLRLNVVNSNVRLQQVLDLLEDAKFGEILNNKNSDWALHKLLQRFKKIKKGAEDYYTAEDDFWKIFTFLGEKSRINKAYKDSGLRLGQEFTDVNGVKRLFNDRTMNELAADLVRNNVPNYAYVSEFVKGLRKFPLGNFVAFPSEILRTGTNIVDTALKEINYKVLINGDWVTPLAARGRQRLMGMAITTAGVPLATIAAAETIYDITKDETAAMRRYVAEWSKNSTLIPFKDEEGKLSYIDFSHLNAYDTLTRPIQTVLNKVEQGRADEDGIIDDFILGLIESTKELGQPFISESIWTEALQDVAPILGRGGRNIEGRQIWNPEDSVGDKMYKAVGHLFEAQAPLNWKQLERLGLSMWPVDSQGRFNERGDEYEFGNEAAGIFGMRRVEVKPERSFNYKITDYKKGIRNSRNLFTAATLKGGVVTPEDVVNAYINSNRALYGVNREMYQDMEAAKILGMGEDAMNLNMEKRGERKAFDALNEGRFRPLKLSKDVKELFEIRAQELGVINPFEAAQDTLDQIAEILEMTSLTGDLFPDLTNPFKGLPLVGGISDAISNLNLGAQTTGASIANQQNLRFGNVTTNLDQANQYAALWPGDSIGQLNKAKLQNQTKKLGQP
jgi:hypothetical protein